jgi:hypothetical protein
MHIETKPFTDKLPLSATPNYVLIDGALWGFDLKKAKNKNKAFRSLYRGKMEETLSKNAPCLFEVEAGGAFEKWVKTLDPVERRVTWLQSSATLDELRHHLRRFLRVKKEKSGTVYFRFYDPLVLHTVLPNLTETQRIEFFNKINYIEIEDKSIEERVRYYLTEEYELMKIKEDLCG